MPEPLRVLVVALWLAATVAGVVGWRAARLRRRARGRLEAETVAAEDAEAEEIVELGPFVVHARLVTIGIAALVASAGVFLGLRPVFVVAFTAIALVLTTILDGVRVESRFARIEAQLGDSIDLMIGALRAGAGLLESMELAAREVESPLKEQLAEVTGKIRYGDEPHKVFTELSERVPLDAFRLFALTLSVNWEVGGSIASSLATVGRTIRDKIELNRRIRSRTTQARVSVIGILGVSYFVGVLMWRADPHRMEEFIGTTFGSNAIGFCLIMQALGLIWMTTLSRIERA